MRRFAAAYADRRDFLLVVKRHTARRRSKIFLQLILTFLAFTPHAPDKSRFILNHICKFFVIVGIIDMLVSVRLCPFKQILLDGF